MMQKSWKMTETLAPGYSSDSTHWELSNECQHDCSNVFQKSLHPCALDESSLSIGRDNKGVVWVCIGVHTGIPVPWGYPKIPVINRINSSRYFFTGTMNKTPRCWYSRQGGKECRDAGSAGKYIAIASSSAGRHWNCPTIDTNARSSTWKSVERATLCILHSASPAPPHFSKH